MRSAPPASVLGAPALDEYRHWRPEYQAKALEALREAQTSPWRPFFCKNQGCNGRPHIIPRQGRDCEATNGHSWVKKQAWSCSACGVRGDSADDWLWEHARADQRPPKWSDPWATLLLSGGRGSGKTRTGAEITHKATKASPRLTLIAPTGPDLRETMVEGISGLLATARPGERPVWEPSKKKLTWPNGCIGLGFSAEEPDRLRGPQHGYVWCDEPAHYPDSEAVWDNMLFGLRVGSNPKVVATSTPKPTQWLKDLIARDDTVRRVVSTYANLHNLADRFKAIVLDKYEGTRMGKQELYGELLEDVEGSLWKYEMFLWADEAPDLVRVVVGVDPAGTANARSDITGIIVLGVDAQGRLYVLADRSGKYSPAQWAKEANKAYEDFSADAIVAEKNYGGDMVKFTLENSGYSGARILLVNSRRGKQIRAEPLVAMYEKHKVFHVGMRGDLMSLEDEQTTWVPGEGDSPNRVDALVHGGVELVRHLAPTEVADPRKILSNVSPLRPGIVVPKLPNAWGW